MKVKNINKTMKVNRAQSLVLLLSLILSGCVYNDKFNCNPSRGVYCKSMSQVDDMITHRIIDSIDIDYKKQKSFIIQSNDK